MANTAKRTKTINIGGKTFSQTETRTGVSQAVKETLVPKALVGSLSTRTDNTSGNATITGTNTITTGQRADIYWAAGRRIGVTIGTVAGQVCPFSGGVGDNLPIAATALQVATPVASTMTFAGSDVDTLAAYCPGANGVVFFALGNGNAALSSTYFANGALDLVAGKMFEYCADGYWPNPLASQSVVTVYMSHKDTTVGHIMKVGALLTT